MKRKIYYVAAAALSLLFLVLLAAAVFTLMLSVRQGKGTEAPNNTEPLYIYVNADTEETETQSVEETWLIKEHNGKIGIFDKDGRLTQVIDTYVKTLPASDRAELGEGFWVSTEHELYSIIEAYSD